MKKLILEIIYTILKAFFSASFDEMGKPKEVIYANKNDKRNNSAIRVARWLRAKNSKTPGRSDVRPERDGESGN